jgi:predicted phosphodiesterase
VRFLIISDIHANLQALEAVLADAEGKYEQVVCCGDLVGYNPNPGAVIEWTERSCSAVVRGNHDKVVSGIDSLDWFNDVAKTAARWTMAELTKDQLAFLQALPQGPVTIEGFQIWHGSPDDEDEYLTNSQDAAHAFDRLEQNMGFFGHTHLQGVFFSKHKRYGAVPGVPKDQQELVFQIEPDVQYLINPGSVGQPRDGDPRAAYALFDTSEKLFSLRRVSYSIQATAEAIKNAGLPEVLAQRLFYGF